MTTNLRDNRNQLVAVTAAFTIAAPQLFVDRPHIDQEGRAVSLPGCGGIALGLHAGMPVDAMLGDHAMPGISLEDAAGASHGLVCVGNRVRTPAGDTAGVVAGKRGGLAPGFIPGQYLGVEAGDEQAARLFPGDALAVETYGRGLALLDFPQVAVLNCSPRILDALSIGMESGALHLPVRAELPGVAAGAGLGSDPWIGDLEIAFGAPEGLRFGDVVAFGDTDARVSRAYRRGFVAIGVVSHGPSPVPGHGFGVTILLSGPREQVQPRISEDAALAPSLLQWREEEKPEWT